MDLGFAIVVMMILLAAFGVLWIFAVSGVELSDLFKRDKHPEERSLYVWADDYLKEGKITTRQYNELMYNGLFLRSGIPSKRKYYKATYKAEYGESVLVNITEEIISLTPEQVLDRYKLDELYTKSLNGSTTIALGTLYARSDRYKEMTEKQFKRELDIINKED